jgi:uncharacterized membrane protein (UPF0127 family)
VRLAALAIVLLLLVCAGSAAAGPQPVTFGHGVVALVAPKHHVRVTVEVARTYAQITRGLMYRSRLAQNAGMVFLFRPPVREWFWMKHTLIPLSIAFFDRRGRIVRMYDMTPCVRDPCAHYDPGRAISGALEVQRGAYRRWRIRIGDRVVLRMLR